MGEEEELKELYIHLGSGILVDLLAILAAMLEKGWGRESSS